MCTCRRSISALLWYGLYVLQAAQRSSIFSNIQHYAVYVRTIGSCMPSRRLRRLDAPLILLQTLNGHVLLIIFWPDVQICLPMAQAGIYYLHNCRTGVDAKISTTLILPLPYQYSKTPTSRRVTAQNSMLTPPLHV